MTFLVPLALIGLLTLPIILLLHILRNRREILAVSSLQLWRNLQQKKHGGKPRFVVLSLMLLLQLCAATALTFALARPALSFLLDRPQHTIFILDMTTSMATEDVALADSTAGSRRFDVARQVIEDHLRTMDEDDTVALISLNARPEIMLTGSGEDGPSPERMLENLEPGATGVDLPAALTLANGLVDNFDQAYEVIVLTDGTYQAEAEALPEMLVPVNWQIISSRPQAEGRVQNLALLNVSSRTLANGQHRLFARVINYGDTPAVATLRVTADDRSVDEVRIDLEPQAEKAEVWTLPEQTQTATVEILESDALRLDNRADLFLAGATRQRVLLVSDTPDLLARALSVQPGVELTVDTLDMARQTSAGFDLIVFDSLPPDLTAWPEGNLLIVNPPLGHPLLPAENFARNLRPDVETSSSLLEGVDLSGVYFSRVSQVIMPDWAEPDLMAFSVDPDQETSLELPIIFNGSIDDNRLVVWAFDLAESNLPARLALPLLTANTLSTLLSPGPPPVVPIGEPILLNENHTIEIPGGRRLFAAPSEEGAGTNRFTRTKQPGLYKIYDNEDSLIAGFAIQAGSALESNLTTQLQPDTLNLNQGSERTLTSPDVSHDEFWPWLAGLALVVVVAEGWMAWRR